MAQGRDLDFVPPPVHIDADRARDLATHLGNKISSTRNCRTDLFQSMPIAKWHPRHPENGDGALDCGEIFHPRLSYL